MVSVGDRVGDLLVVQDLGAKDFGSYRDRLFLCRCRCGSEIEVRASNLRKPRSCRPCGIKRTAASRIKHGKSHSRTWNIHRGMKQRCLNPKNHAFKHYGGRGITVCERWSGDQGFENFLADMGEAPDGMTLDRKENDGNYEPDNCRWVPQALQTTNTRQNHLVTYQGETHCIAEWSRRLGIPAAKLRCRARAGLTGDALFSAGDLRASRSPAKDVNGRFLKTKGATA